MAILKTIRPINLIIMALLMWAMRFFLIKPILAILFIYPYLNDFHFILLTLSVILIAAGGYIINDCCDAEIDEINKPSKNQIGVNLSYQSAQYYYYSFNILAFFIACYLSFKCNSLKLASIHLLAAGLLWLYANNLKRKLFVGNLAIASLSALVVLIPIFFEPIIFYNPEVDFAQALKYVLVIGLFMAMFAFIISLAREIVKDMEDLKGDTFYGCRNIPIVYGIHIAKWITISLLLLILIAMGMTIFYYHTLIYQFYIFGVFALIIYIQFLLINLSNTTSNKISFISTLLKLLMIIGFGSIIFSFKYFVNQ
jgi:4-hydroxybenzoate polyprenyltransferase